MSTEKLRARPVLRYHGGKWRIAPRVIAHFPPHRRYVEPYGGGAGVLLRKSREGVALEVYNDLDSEVVNVFEVLRDPVKAVQLRRVVELTPFARSEFTLAYEPSDDPVEQARRTVARSFMAFGTTHMRPDTSRTGFRASQVQRNSCSAADFASWPAQIDVFTARLRGVVIENRPAVKVIKQQDSPETLFFCDPPYPRSTRSSIAGKGRNNGAYRHEMTDDDHRVLASELREISGMAIICGYACDLYDRELYAGWERLELQTVADGGRPRVEILWLSPAASRARSLRMGA
jgi:DNA adenine methylase